MVQQQNNNNSPTAAVQQLQQSQSSIVGPTTNRFGFRQPVQNKPPPVVDFNVTGDRLKKNVTIQTTGVRSKSEGPREAFFKQKIQP